jgi:hypothetical protein
MRKPGPTFAKTSRPRRVSRGHKDDAPARGQNEARTGSAGGPAKTNAARTGGALVSTNRLGYFALPLPDGKAASALPGNAPGLPGRRRSGGNATLALGTLARQLTCATDGLGLLPRLLLGRLFVEVTQLHFAENALALKLLFQRSQRLINIIIANDYLQRSTALSQLCWTVFGVRPVQIC